MSEVPFPRDHSHLSFSFLFFGVAGIGTGKFLGVFFLLLLLLLLLRGKENMLM